MCNLAFVSQSVEIEDEVVFTGESSVWRTKAVYPVLAIDRQIPPIMPHGRPLPIQFEAPVETFK
jgi:oleate hydratase